MIKNKLVKRIIKEIKEVYKDIGVRVEETSDGFDIIINSRQVFCSQCFSLYIFKNTKKDKESGKFINFLYED